jgi:hypothetical protein
MVGAPNPAFHIGHMEAGEVRVVPVFTVIRSTEEEPDCVPAVSPRVRRRPSSWPRGQLPYTAQGVRYLNRSSCAPLPAQIRQVRAGVTLRDVTTSVPRVLLSVPLAGPAPSGSAGTSRLCQGCSRSPQHHPDQAAVSSAGNRHARAASAARSAQSSRVPGFLPRGTATSCRNTSNSTSFDAAERPGRTN